MSSDKPPAMSAAEQKTRDDRTIFLVSRSLRRGHPFLLAQGGNGRVIHIGGDQIASFVDDLFFKAMAGQVK